MEKNKDYIELDGKYLLNLKNYHLKPDFSDKYLFHNDLEISLIKSGIGVYQVNGTVYPVEKGDVFIFNNVETHSISNSSSTKELVNMVIMFDQKFIWSIESNLFDSKYLKIFFNRNTNFQNRLEHDRPTAKDIAALLLEIENEFINRVPEYELMIKVKLLNILVILNRYFNYTKTDNNPIDVKRYSHLLLVNKIMNYIDSNLSQPLRLEDLSVIAHMNPTYFSFFFKKYLGLSPIEYISRKRVRKSIEFLENTDKTILEIAGLCGFNSSASFNKMFKKITGRVPSYFRKNQKTAPPM